MSLIPKIKLLVGSLVTIIHPEPLPLSICLLSETEILVEFDEECGDIEPIKIISSSMENGSIIIYSDSQDSVGAVNGIHPFLGKFTLSLGKETSEPISADASASEIKSSIKNMLTVGSVTMTKDTIGIRSGSDGTIITPPIPSVFNIWSITFADDTKPGCEPGS